MSSLGRLLRGALCAYLLGGICLLASCRPSQERRSAGGLVLPAHLTDPQEQRDYLVAHYWEWLELPPEISPAELQRQLKDYCGLIAGLPPSQVRPSLWRGLQLFLDPLLPVALERYREQLYQAGSPTYDEVLYAEVLRWMASSEKLDTLQQVEALLELKRLRHNAPGAIAQDFPYQLQDSLQGRLSTFTAPYTLLLLVRDSLATEEVWGKTLATTPSLRSLIEQEKLRPLVVYTGERRPDSLLRASLPKSTTWGYDSARLIAREHRYDLKHGTGIYLLDRDKRILLRNATLSEVAATLDYEK